MVCPGQRFPAVTEEHARNVFHKVLSKEKRAIICLRID